MAHAYTPGLKVSARTRVSKVRRLPLAGKVLVREGDRVRADDVVAEAELPGNAHPVNAAGRLGVRAGELRAFMLKVEGERVEKDEPLAETKPLLKFLKAACTAPVSGTIESISDVTGQVMLREPPQKVSLTAYVSGTVRSVLPEEGAVVETEAALVQGIFGVGGERVGALRVLAGGPEDEVGPEALDSSCRNCIIVLGARATAAVVQAARRAGAAAVVAGAIGAADLRGILGYEIGVAVTGSERIGLTIVLTEGFGRLPIAARTFELLKGLDGRQASVCGATQIRAGVVRPEVIVPLEGEPADGGPFGPLGIRRTANAWSPAGDPVTAGSRVRIIRSPHFGRIGRVAELVTDPVRIETEAVVRVLRVEVDGGEVLTVPRANIEIIED